jgi:hypothetical protein
VVENFLAARNARDPIGATYFSAPLLVIHDDGGQWIADEPATRQWLRQFTDAYVIDMLVKPHATGDTITWVERLADRSLPYRDALRESMEVSVDVVVQNGKITSYTAPYPALAPRPLQGSTHSVSSHPSPTAPGLPPAVLLIASGVALPAGVILVMCAGRAISRARPLPDRQKEDELHMRDGIIIHKPALVA